MSKLLLAIMLGVSLNANQDMETDTHLIAFEDVCIEGHMETQINYLEKGSWVRTKSNFVWKSNGKTVPCPDITKKEKKK